MLQSQYLTNLADIEVTSPYLQNKLFNGKRGVQATNQLTIVDL